LSHSIGYDKRPISSRFLARLGYALTYFVKPSILQISGCDGIRQSGFRGCAHAAVDGQVPDLARTFRYEEYPPA